MVLPWGLILSNHGQNNSPWRRQGGLLKQTPEPPQLNALDAEEQGIYFKLLLGNQGPHLVSR